MDTLKQLPFYYTTYNEFNDLFLSDERKLNELIENNDIKEYINECNMNIDNDKYLTIESLNNIANISKADISIFHLNIRSLNKHADELVNLITSLKADFDCICLTEIGATNLDMYASLLQGYVFHKIPPNNCSRGGVGIYIKTSLKLEDKPNLTVKCNEPCENKWVHLSKGKSEILLGVVYRHPNGNIGNFNDSLEVTVSEIDRAKYDKVIILGDINIDLLKFNEAGKARHKQYLDMMLSHGYNPGITLPSRIGDHSATLIDHIFMKEKTPSEKIISGNLYSDISDHFASVLFIFKKQKITKQVQKFKVRIFGTKNTDAFASLIKEANWDEIRNSNDVNKCTDAFQRIVSNSYNKAFPVKLISNSRMKDKPWVTTNLKRCILKKNKIFANFKSKKTMLSKMAHKTYRNILNSCLRQAKSNYFKELFNNKVNRVSKMWTVMGNIINPKKGKSNNLIKRITTDDDQSYLDDTDIANALNTHFCTVDKKTAAKIGNTSANFTSYLKNPVEKSFFFLPIKEHEIIAEIKALKGNKSPGHDGIKPSIIKATFEHLVSPLSHIYNISINSGIFPDIWKVAKVIPVFKKGERYLAENYRPISLLSCFEKIFERLVVKRMMTFIKKHKILYELQFGYRENHSTVHALLEITDQIYSKLDDDNCAIGVFLDLSKAFDTIDHKILLYKLHHYGFRGVIGDWFSSYLSNRKQYTYCNKAQSALGTIETGVPQGSVLGPILFTIFVNDLANAMNDAKPRLFADDTNIFYFSNKVDDLAKVINSELTKLDEWFKANKLLINTSKTNHCLFKPNRNKIINNEFTIEMGSKLKEVNSLKYLGLQIDCNLNWNDHIDILTNSLVKYCSMFTKLRHLVPAECLKTLFLSLVQSKISYALEVYGVAKECHLKRLQVLQNRMLKILQFKNYRYSTNILHKCCGILKVKDLYEAKILNFMHKVHHNPEKLPNAFHNYFETNESKYKYETRQRKDYKLCRTRKHWGDQMLKNKGARLWNNLPDNIKHINNLKIFSDEIKNLKILKYQ